MMDQLSDSIPNNTRPFTPFIILSPDDQVILYFTQTFAHLAGIHPSTTPIPTSTPIFQNLNLDKQNHTFLDSYKIHYLAQSTPFFHENFCIEELIHELRTASLIVDLGAHVLAASNDQAPILLQKLLRASHRQRVSTLIASDFLQLQTTSPIIRAISLVKILTSSLSHSRFTSKIRFIITSPIKGDSIAYINPIIWGNFYSLSNFFTTLFSWLKTKPITMEMKTINPVSVQVIMSIPENHFLSDIQGFLLISRYLHFIMAYFNGCSWMNQNSIHILFPLAHLHLKGSERI